MRGVQRSACCFGFFDVRTPKIGNSSDQPRLNGSTLGFRASAARAEGTEQQLNNVRPRVSADDGAAVGGRRALEH